MTTLPTVAVSNLKVRLPFTLAFVVFVQACIQWLWQHVSQHITLVIVERKMVDGLRVFTYDELGISVNSGGMSFQLPSPSITASTPPPLLLGATLPAQAQQHSPLIVHALQAPRTALSTAHAASESQRPVQHIIIPSVTTNMILLELFRLSHAGRVSLDGW